MKGDGGPVGGPCASAAGAATSSARPAAQASASVSAGRSRTARPRIRSRMGEAYTSARARARGAAQFGESASVGAVSANCISTENSSRRSAQRDHMSRVRAASALPKDCCRASTSWKR